jgi:hypothetical protein
LQHIGAGDLIPMGPGEETGMWVKEFVPGRSILWEDKNHLTTWAWALVPMPDGSTRPRFVFIGEGLEHPGGVLLYELPVNFAVVSFDPPAERVAALEGLLKIRSAP